MLEAKIGAIDAGLFRGCRSMAQLWAKKML